MGLNSNHLPDTTEGSGSGVQRYSSIAVGVFLLAVVLGIAWVATHGLNARHFLIGVGFVSVALAVGSAISYRYRALANHEDIIPATVTMNVVIFLCAGLVTVSIYTAMPPHNWTASMIWSLAAVLSGGSVGFLFGIPRSRTGKSLVPSSTTPTPPTTTLPATSNTQPLDVSGAAPTPPPDTGTQQIPSTGNETAIEQISDWLTKIIVGVGLTNLRDLPRQLNALGKYVATSIDPNGPINIGLGLGIVIYFAVLGVITGYLMTQIFLLNLVNRQSS
jgi:hypothetical protein